MERSVSARLTATTTGLKAALASAGAQVSSFARQTNAAIQSNRSEFSKMGTGLLAIGGAAALGFGLATREAIQWESAFAGVRKTIDDSAEGYDRLERDLRDLALVLPASAVEIAGVAEAAGQLGVARENIVSFTRVMIDLGNTTNLVATDAATGLARFMNILGTAPENVGRLGATLVDLGNKGASTEAEILAMGLRIAGVATIAGLSESQVLGLANAMSSLGLEADAGGSAITRVFTTMDDAVKTGGTSLTTFANIAGVSAAQFAAAYRADPVEALTLFLGGLNDTAAAGGSLTSALESLGLADIRVSDTLRRMSADVDGVTESVKNGHQAWEDQTALVEEAAKRYETTESKIQLARNAITDAGIDIGNKLLPVVAQLAGALADLAGWFTSLNPAVQNTILVLAGMIAVGGLIGGMALKTIASLVPLITTLKGVDAAAKVASLSMKALGAGAIVGGLLAVAFGIQQIQEALDADKLKGDVGQLAGALLRFSVTGEAGGEAARLFGKNLSGLSIEFRRFLDGSSKSLEDFTDTATDIGKVDQALAEMVTGGDAQAAADVIERLGLSAEEGALIFARYKAALDLIDTKEQQASLAETERRAHATTDEYGRLVDATGALIDPTQEMTDEAQHLADKWGLSASSAIDLADGIREIVDATEEATDNNRSAQAAQIDYQSALTDAAQAIADYKTAQAEAAEKGEAFANALADTATGFDLTTTAGQGFAKQALAIAEAASGNADAILRTTDNTADYRAALQDGHDDLVAFYTNLGIGAEKAEELADKIIKVPPEVPVEVKTPGMDTALGKTKALDDLVRGVPETHDTVFTVATAAAHEAIRALQTAIDGMRGRVIYLDLRYQGPGPLQGLGYTGETGGSAPRFGDQSVGVPAGMGAPTSGRTLALQGAVGISQAAWQAGGQQTTTQVDRGELVAAAVERAIAKLPVKGDLTVIQHGVVGEPTSKGVERAAALHRRLGP